jgi:hypothetical protein
MKREAIMAETLTFDVSQFGPFLATRSSARTARTKLENKTASLDAPDVVVIDFAGVDAMTISFADEFIGKFYTTIGAGDISPQVILLRGLNEETNEAITVCLERRELIAAAMIGPEIHLIAAPEFLQETYRHAGMLETFRAIDLAENLSITPQNVNTRLKRLTAAGAIRREHSNTSGRGGKEFMYSVPSPKHG